MAEFAAPEQGTGLDLPHIAPIPELPVNQITLLSDPTSNIGSSDEVPDLMLENTASPNVPKNAKNSTPSTSGGSAAKERKKTKAVVKGSWTKEEDQLLVELVTKFGAKRWSHIASHLNGRISKQCRERWHNQLNPNVRKDPWTEEEDQLILEQHKKNGNSWAEMAKMLNGRTDNAIKNRFNATLKRRLQEENGELPPGTTTRKRPRQSTKKPKARGDGLHPTRRWANGASGSRKGGSTGLRLTLPHPATLSYHVGEGGVRLTNREAQRLPSNDPRSMTAAAHQSPPTAHMRGQREEEAPLSMGIDGIGMGMGIDGALDLPGVMGASPGPLGVGSGTSLAAVAPAGRSFRTPDHPGARKPLGSSSAKKSLHNMLSSGGGGTPFLGSPPAAMLAMGAGLPPSAGGATDGMWQSPSMSHLFAAGMGDAGMPSPFRMDALGGTPLSGLKLKTPVGTYQAPKSVNKITRDQSHHATDVDVFNNEPVQRPLFPQDRASKATGISTERTSFPQQFPDTSAAATATTKTSPETHAGAEALLALSPPRPRRMRMRH